MRPIPARIYRIARSSASFNRKSAIESRLNAATRFIPAIESRCSPPHMLGKSFLAEEIQNANRESESAAARPNERYSMRCEIPVAPGDILRIRISA